MTTEAEIQTNYTPRILVVDDEVRIRDACQLVLEGCGYRVSVAATGAEGLELIQDQHFDIILLDLMMPKISGFDVLAQVKALHPDTVIIVITGYATLEHSLDAMKKGAFDFIPKPFTPEHLRVTIAKAIDYNQTLRDISDTRSRLRTLVDRISDGVMCTNHEHRVVLTNPAFLQMIGCSAESVIGSSVDEFIDISRIREMIQETLDMKDSNTTELTEEIPVNGHDHSEGTILNVRCTPFRDRTGRNIGVITVLHDITALKKIDRMKSEFVSMVSHEIRSPMNSVMMQIKVILDGLAGELSEKQRDILTRTYRKIENLAHMTTELLDLARIESGLITLEREPVAMADLIREQIAFHLPSAASASIEIISDIPETLPSILANRRNIEEVMSNLITNAIKYSPGGGQITVSASIVNDYLCIRVKDTGLGISDEDQRRIFKRFYRVKDEKTRYINGTGLGLAIVKSILESHQGRIKIESQEGKGSTFSAFLPILTG